MKTLDIENESLIDCLNNKRLCIHNCNTCTPLEKDLPGPPKLSFNFERILKTVVKLLPPKKIGM